tara:strand:- start:856 stop:1539 length:684 start_codon:yes stop_codon:yes gene_type:complete
MNTLILAGGKGERLKPITTKIPKPMVKVKNKPIIWYILKQLKFYNINRINIAVGYKSSLITEYVDKNFSDLNINFYNDGDVDIIERIRSVVESNPTQDILILYGDTISDVNIRALLKFSSENLEHSILTIWPLQTNFGVVEINHNEEVVGFKEKPKLDKFINIGYFILRTNMFKHLKEFNSYGDFLTFCGDKKIFKAYIHDGEHFTVNNVVELRQAEENLNKIKIVK